MRGRDFTLRDDAAAPGVAIVNDAFVRQYVLNGNPLDQRVIRRTQFAASQTSSTLIVSAFACGRSPAQLPNHAMIGKTTGWSASRERLQCDV